MKGMNLTKTTLMLISSMAVVAVLFAPSLSAAITPGDDVGATITHPSWATGYQIFAGQTILVGYLYVWNDGVNINVEYVLQDGWEMVESHVDMATDLGLIPQTNGNPIPGHFAQGEEYTELTSEDAFAFATVDGQVFIAAHAAVVHVAEDGSIDQEETAWAAFEVGDMPFTGSNWATYVTFGEPLL